MGVCNGSGVGTALGTNSRQPVCLVTGGARGIGAATSLLAARRGYAVCVNYLTSDAEAERLVGEIQKGGGKAMAFKADVSRDADLDTMFAAIDQTLGPVTALVNNAAIPGERRAIIDVDAEFVRQVFDVNLLSVFLCTRRAALRMGRSCGGEGGAIVNLSSAATRTGGDRLSAYVASKGGVEAITKASAIELANEGIRVNAVRPGIIATERQPLEDPVWRGRVEARIPLRRLGTPAEVANAILWLLSDAAAFVTGAIIDVSGGR